MHALTHTSSGFNLLFLQHTSPSSACRKRQDSRSARQGLLAYVLGSLQRQWLTSLCTVMFFFYPTVVTALLSIYDCQGVDSPAVSASNPLVVSH